MMEPIDESVDMPANDSRQRQSATKRMEQALALARRTFASVGSLFPRNATIDDVVTRASIAASPEEVWRRLMFYEEVPHRPRLLLRIFLPMPLRTSKSGLSPGAMVQCSYSAGGTLSKVITSAERPSTVRFDVVEQNIGIEPCLTSVRGSYRIERSRAGSDVALTTAYRGHLRPRWLWRTPERLLVHELHRHILRGMGATFGWPQAGRRD